MRSALLEISRVMYVCMYMYIHHVRRKAFCEQVFFHIHTYTYIHTYGLEIGRIMQVCMYVCMYVCMCVHHVRRKALCEQVLFHIHIHVHTYIHIPTHKHTYIHNWDSKCTAQAPKPSVSKYSLIYTYA
jgi:hypothetical protein